MHNGGPSQLLAVVALTVALFVAGSLATGHITWNELVADPPGSVWRSFQPTVDSLWP